MKNLIVSVLCTGILFVMISCNNNPQTESVENTSQKIPDEQEVVEGEPTTEVQVPETKAERVQNVSSKEVEAFDYLEKLMISSSDDIYVKYNQSSTEVFNTEVKDLGKNDPLYPEEGPGVNDIKLMKTKINASSNDEYIVVFGWGPSADPHFRFYRLGNYNQPAFTLYTLQIFIPGNGNIYTAGHVNNSFNQRKKYRVVGNELKEVRQPYYYVGLKTKTLKAVQLYKDKTKTQVVAGLPQGYDIEVLLNEEGSSWYLVKTAFGLCGWVEVEIMGRQPGNIDGIFYAGD